MVQLVMETPDKYTGDLLGARYTVSTSSRPRGHLTQADVIKSGYIGENHYWGIHEDEYYRGDVYQTTYTTSVNNSIFMKKRNQHHQFNTKNIDQETLCTMMKD